MDDWEAFREWVPWFVPAGADVAVGSTERGSPLPGPVAARFPTLAALVVAADATAVAIDDRRYELLVWDGVTGDRLGWLCPVAETAPMPGVCDDHALLLTAFGGVVERLNEPSTWLLNHHEALTRREAAHDATFIDGHSFVVHEGGEWPIDPIAHYAIAREANGNTTICHRVTGEVLLFAPDHAFDHVTPLPGCPEYTLYRLSGVRWFVEWVERVAAQWAACVADASNPAGPRRPSRNA